ELPDNLTGRAATLHLDMSLGATVTWSLDEPDGGEIRLPGAVMQPRVLPQTLDLVRWTQDGDGRLRCHFPLPPCVDLTASGARETGRQTTGDAPGAPTLRPDAGQRRASSAPVRAAPLAP